MLLVSVSRWLAKSTRGMPSGSFSENPSIRTFEVDWTAILPSTVDSLAGFVRSPVIGLTPAWAPSRVSVFSMSTFSWYVPGATSMVSPGLAALTAPWIEVKAGSPLKDPVVLTNSVERSCRPSTASTSRRGRRDGRVRVWRPNKYMGKPSVWSWGRACRSSYAGRPGPLAVSP